MEQKEISAPKYRMPAEWEPHEATWVGWPHNTTDWPGKFSNIPWVYGEIVRKIASGESVRIIVNSTDHERRARQVLTKVGVSPSRLQFYRFPTNRGWTRDFGPIFIRQAELPSALAIAGFRFNAWAKYPDWKKDSRIHQRVAAALDIRLIHPGVAGRDFILEGGSIDVNGLGSLLTTEECLLDQGTQVRNPGLTRNEIENVLREYLGVTNTLWLGRGIAGDDTHGHVDDLCRFVGPGRVVLCQEQDSHDENYRALEENRERLQGMRLENGSSIEVIPLPMPKPLYFRGLRLPASYANFYISNTAVLVPTFNDPSDRLALHILAELFHDKPVVGIHAVDLVWGFGTIHCITQQQPAIRIRS